MPYIRAPFASNGDKEAVPVAAQTDGSISYVQGYPTAYSLDPNTDPSARRIERPKMNQLFFDITTAIKEMQESGVAPYITAAQNGGTAFSYGIGAVVSYNNVVYQSLIGANTNLPTVAAAWAPIANQKNSLQIMLGNYTGDLNAITAPGIYSTTTATTNQPANVGGVVEHFAHAAGSIYVQVWHAGGVGNTHYVRTASVTGGVAAWTAWKQLATTDTLGTAAARNVGTTSGSNQLPDMASFTSGVSGNSAWCRFPNGMIFQWGYIITSSSANVNVTFPVVFSQLVSTGVAYSLTATAAANINANASGSSASGISGIRSFNVAGTQQANGVFWTAMGF